MSPHEPIALISPIYGNSITLPKSGRYLIDHFKQRHAHATTSMSIGLSPQSKPLREREENAIKHDIYREYGGISTENEYTSGERKFHFGNIQNAQKL